MGEVIIELPFEVRRRFRLTDAKTAAEVLEQLEKLDQTAEIKKLQGEVKFRLQGNVTDDEVLGVWADRKEPPDEIARQLRQGNRQHG